MLSHSIIRGLLSSVSPSGFRGRLTILIFHRVLKEADPLFPDEVDRKRFDEIVSWLTTWFNVLPLEEAASRLLNGDLPARAACITFDDGYADNVTNALPILQRYRAPATFFIATGFLNGKRMWNDTIIEAVRNSRKSILTLRDLKTEPLPLRTIAEKRAAVTSLIGRLKYLDHSERSDIATAIAEYCAAPLPSDLMMTDAGVVALHEAGMTIGAHTTDHPILRQCSNAEALHQIAASRDYLESQIRDSVRLFAYPNGKPKCDYTRAHVRQVRKLGFLAAVSTAPGASGTNDDIFQLRRFTPWDRNPHRFALRLAINVLRRPVQLA